MARAEDKFAWLRDDEFARQALAGINPVTIERVKVIISNNLEGHYRHLVPSPVDIDIFERYFGPQVFPPVSNLDPAVYGPPESGIREEHIAGQLEGMTVKQVN